MKIFITVILLIFSTILYGQNDAFELPDSLSAIEVEYETLDSTTIKYRRTIYTDSPHYHFPNVVSYIEYDDSEIGYSNKLAYYIKDKNKWKSFYLPFSNSTVELINIDKKDLPELIVRGSVSEYGSGGGFTIRTISIYNIDSIPIRIFNVDYGCEFESFGDRTPNGEPGYTKIYEREIHITNKGIKIFPINQKEHLLFDCNLTNISSGFYVLKDRRIRRK